MKQLWTTLFSWLFVTLFVTFFISIPAMTSAYSLTFDPGEILKDSSRLGTRDPAYIVFSVVNTALIFLGTITLVTIVVAGFMWLFAAGEEEKITKAKDLLKGSIIGLVIVLSSYGLAQYVFLALRAATTG